MTCQLGGIRITSSNSRSRRPRNDAGSGSRISRTRRSALLSWRFCCGYVGAHPEGDLPRLPLLFPVLPIVLHQATAELLRRTRPSSGLRAFAAKFGDSQISKQDLLLQVHERAARRRALSLQSIELAAAGHLIQLSDGGEVDSCRAPRRAVFRMK